jgi:hypothetical protein
VRLRIAGVLPPAGDEGEDDQASRSSKARKRSGSKIGSEVASQAKPKIRKGGRRKR